MLNDFQKLRVAGVALILLALAGCASTPPAPGAKSAAARDVPRNTCAATPTGLVATPPDCATFGHTWTQDNISRTGAQTTAGALRLLDPTVTVTGH
jgi:hypothetical protein